MEKSKLISVRISKGMSQKIIADKMNMDVSTYNRKEKGVSKIRQEEWIRLADILAVPIEEIYQNEESHVFVFKDNSIGNYIGTNHIYAIPESMLDVQRKYIKSLEQEIERLNLLIKK